MWDICIFLLVSKHACAWLTLTLGNESVGRLYWFVLGSQVLLLLGQFPFCLVPSPWVSLALFNYKGAIGS